MRLLFISHVHQTSWSTFHIDVLQISNLPAWSLREIKIDLYVQAFIRRLSGPLVQSHVYVNSANMSIFTPMVLQHPQQHVAVFTLNIRYQQPLCRHTQTKRFWKKHSFANKIFLLNSDLRTVGYNIVFMWVPGHTGVSRNEIADSLANLASSSNPHLDEEWRGMSTENQYTHLWIHIYSLIADSCLNVWNNEYKDDTQGFHVQKIFPTNHAWLSKADPKFYLNYSTQDWTL